MFSRRLAARLALLATLAAVSDFAAAQTQPQSCKGGTGCAASSCPTSITPAQAVLPTAACPFAGESQAAVDVFSWNEFIALNWPATPACTADPKKSILNIKPGNQGPVVWQTQMSADDVFVAPNQAPAAWCKNSSVGALFARKPRAFAQTSKLGAKAHGVEQLAAAISQPTDPLAVGGVVTDQSGRWLRYELLMNRTEYNAITTNNWYRLSVLNAQSSITLPTGSLELKSAWKILTAPEIKSGRYYTTVATVYNTPDGAKSPGKNPVTLGLVGLHIIQKTPQQPGFFWSTFEQVDNEKVFFNPNSSAPVNTQTAKQPYVELDPKTGKPLNAPVQIKRVNPIPADPQLNAYYQKLLAGSVFANYRLVSTQWQTGGAPQGTPPNVANTVIETYVQSVASKPPESSTGCLACHKNATAANGKTLTDHSFMFLQAQ
jgi:hypothetical protein